MRTARLCPFSAEPLLWRGHDGAWTLTVCVRGTFALVHGREATLAEVQEPIVGDRPHDGDPRASLHSASDIVPYKPRVDVVLIGSAFAPGDAPADALVARLRVGGLDKALGVVGDRFWIEGPDGLEPGAPVPFRSLPLRYERAARANDNPGGFDLARPPAPGALAAPNLEAVDDSPFATGTVGFGPVLSTAPTRRSLLSPEGFAWATGGLRGPLPRGFDFSFFNAAPRDQQLPSLPEGTTLLLEHLHRDHPRLEARLPSLRARAFLLGRVVDRAIEIALHCDTLWIDTDRSLITLSWRGVIAADPARDTLAIAAESPSAPLREADVIRMAAEHVMVDDETTSTALLDHHLPLDPFTEETTTSLVRRS